MRHIGLLLLVVATPASADWKAANTQVTQAAKNPRIAAVLKEVNKIDAAIVSGNKDDFIAPFAADAIVNSPANNISTRAIAEARYKSGQLTYEYLHRSIEYAGLRRGDEVLLMGEETYKPPVGAPLGGKVVRRRFTDIWRLQGGKWRLSVRQATIFEAN